MAKKTKKEMFIMFGEKVNGRIRKNEQYTLDEFEDLISIKSEVDVKYPNWFTWIFNRKKVIKLIKKDIEKLTLRHNKIIIAVIEELIKKDKEGKK